MHTPISIQPKVPFLATVLLAVSVNAAAQSGAYSNITAYPTLSGTGFYSDITAGSDGALWFTETNGNNIGRITTSGVVTEYTVPTPNCALFAITSGPDGALWFTEYEGNKIGRITTAGAITEYDVPTPGGQPNWIVTGPDGALWFTEFYGNKIGRITTAGAITEYSVTSGNQPWGITAGPDGALWFAEYGSSQIGRITTAGVITQFQVSSSPYWIAAGSDGALWFAETYASKIGRITTSGVVTEYPAHENTYGIAAGPDGALWFVEGPSQIGRAAACGLGFSASFAGNTMTLNFNLGIDTPATFNINLRNASGPIAQPFSRDMAAVVPPQAFTMTWTPFPNLGEVIVKPTLATQPGGTGLGLCSEWTTVNTAQ